MDAEVTKIIAVVTGIMLKILFPDFIELDK